MSEEKIEHNEQAGGNTKTPAPLRIRRVVFTLNNYDEQEYDNLIEFAIKHTKYYIIGKECGQNGTPHLQGYFEFNNRNGYSFKQLKEWFPRNHWEKAKGNKKQNYTYCSKEKDYICSEVSLEQLILDSEYKDVTWKWWQQDILDMLKEAPDPRKIYWFWEPKGNVGKSYLLKYICIKNIGVIIGNGKRDDVFNQINTCLESGIIPKIIVIDIPRDNFKFFNYAGIESIKNGCFYSGKYEGGQCIFPRPHVIIFANESPNPEGWSEDKYAINRITSEETHKFLKDYPIELLNN